MTKRILRLPASALATAAAIASGLAISAPVPPPPPVPVQFAADSQLSVATSAIHDFVEPAIAASPLDTRNLVAAFFGEWTPFEFTCFVRFSRDGGATWATGGSIATKTPDDLWTAIQVRTGAARGCGPFRYPGSISPALRARSRR